MPVHDWTRVDAGVFHDFHNVWIAALRNQLNEGLLPPDYYAMSEQHAGKYIVDVMTLHRPSVKGSPRARETGGLAVADAPPQVRRQISLSPTARSLRKTLAIRHVSGHQLIAVIEIVSPANKDRHEHVDEFLGKIEDALGHGVHVLMVDLFPPGKHDRDGLHCALWERMSDEPDEAPPPHEPLTLASYVAQTPIRAFLEHVAFGSRLPEMPLFINPDRYVKTPLEATYDTAWNGTPQVWREILQRRERRKRGKRP